MQVLSWSTWASDKLNDKICTYNFTPVKYSDTIDKTCDT
jgi:hypothetical protein